MPLFSAQLQPGRSLGFLVLGASLHDTLTRLKAEPQNFPKLQLLYSQEQPVTEPVCINLPQNGIRLRFDGPEQRLRLIEVVDFAKNHIIYKEKDLVRPSNDGAEPGQPPAAGVDNTSTVPPGPTFRHIYHRLLGPTYAGEFIPPPETERMGTYVLSYPGVAYNFPMAADAYSPSKDVVTLLSASSSQTATSMAIFSGASWAEARSTLWTEVLPSIKATVPTPRGKDTYPDEVSLVQLHGGGRVQLCRKWTNHSFVIQLGSTTPQELIMELGPPNAIYRKNDQKMTVHKTRAMSDAVNRPNMGQVSHLEELTDTDQSSTNTASDDSDDEDVEAEHSALQLSGECFYNYFYHGFDILLSTPVPPSPVPPSHGHEAHATRENGIKNHSPDKLVATKLILHGNVPGSYEFNRHGRCRWEIPYLHEGGVRGQDDDVVDSETHFQRIEQRMSQKWKEGSAVGQEAPRERQRGMVLNRGWGDSPGSSCELLGGWEESGARRMEAHDDSTTTLYGFPGMVFEVLKTGFVSTVTVF